MSVESDIKEKYPNLYFLLKDREIGPLLRQAVDPSASFSPESFYARLTNTNWWRSQNESQRQWQFLLHTDPGTARSRINSMRLAIQQVASRLGINLTSNQLAILAVDANARGYDPNGPEVQLKIAQLRTNKNTGPGAIRTAMQRVQGLAYGEYMIPFSTHTAGVWADQIARGLKTEDDLRAELQRKAVSKYPYLATMINSGQTPAQIFAPHRDMIASELEVTPGQIDLTRGKWSKVLDVYDKQLGRHRPMTLYETQTLVRQDDKWWQTSKGKAADANMANTILERFGKRKM